MKTKTLILALSLLFLVSSALYAQEKPEIWSWGYVEAVKGKTAELEKAIKEKTEKFNKLSVDPIYTYRVMSGSRAGQLVRVIGPKDWTYYEKPNTGLAHWNQYVAPLIANSSGREFYNLHKDMSYDGNPDAVRNYVEVNEYIVKPTNEYAFTSFVREVAKVAKENKSKARFQTYKITSGGQGGKYVIAWSYTSLTEKDDQSENWPAWYNKIKGSPQAWASDLGKLQESIQIFGENSFLCSFVPELSSK